MGGIFYPSPHNREMEFPSKTQILGTASDSSSMTHKTKNSHPEFTFDQWGE